MLPRGNIIADKIACRQHYRDMLARMPRPIPGPVRRSLRVLGDNVGTWRRLRGLTQDQLADRSGVHRDTVARIERGDGGTSIENLLRVLRGLGLLDSFTDALDPYESDVGRMRSDEQLPQRVRPKRLTDDG
jgi:DNA-binding XRE family transcriptional regulator